MSELLRSVAVIQASYLPGSTLEEVAASVCELAEANSCYVQFTYEGVEMLVYFHHTAEEVVKEWRKRKEQQNVVEFGDLSIITKYEAWQERPGI